MAAAANFDWKNVSGTGLYPVSMVARLVHENQRVVRAWLEGYPNSEAQPIIERQLPQIDGKTVFGFLDLIEARFIKHFTELGLSPQSIRKAAIKMRAKYGEDHPFATKNRFMTDGRKIFMEVAETDEEQRILDVITDNFVMGPVISQSLFDHIFYAEDLAIRWRPVPGVPIVLDPKIAFGRPVVEGKWTPTHVIYKSFRVEGDASAVADEFGLDENVVRQAVDFERTLIETVH